MAKKVKYVTGSSASSYTTNTLTDKIWLFSDTELYGGGIYSGTTAEGLGLSGVAYSKFTHANSKFYLGSSSNPHAENLRIAKDENSLDDWWWLRSLFLDMTHSSQCVYGYGAIYDVSANNECGLAFGFCIR